MTKKIAIIGAGWYGVHLALSLKARGYTVEIFEKKSDIFMGVSGTFGIRLHQGPHYPRSPETRKSCRETFQQFVNTYPELAIEQDIAVYGLGICDSDGNPSKVSATEFSDVCAELGENSQAFDYQAHGFQNLHLATNVKERSMVLGEPLRHYFKQKLIAAEIPCYCNCLVGSLRREKNKTIMEAYQESAQKINSPQLGSEQDTTAQITTTVFTSSYDLVINASGYQALIPPSFKDHFLIDMEVVYQPCIALMYKDTKANKSTTDKPISYIVMDGWFPCLMPYIRKLPFEHEYILTHGKFTIMGSCATPEEAQKILSNLSDEFIEEQIKPRAEQSMAEFWSQFLDRFKYIGWTGEVIAKLKSKSEFRSAVTFKDTNQGVIHIIPGKVSNIFNAEEEVVALLENKNCLTEENFQYMENGVLHRAKDEIETKPNPDEPNTCTLKTFDDIIRETPCNSLGTSYVSQNGALNPLSLSCDYPYSTTGPSPIASKVPTEDIKEHTHKIGPLIFCKRLYKQTDKGTRRRACSVDFDRRLESQQGSHSFFCPTVVQEPDNKEPLVNKLFKQ